MYQINCHIVPISSPKTLLHHSASLSSHLQPGAPVLSMAMRQLSVRLCYKGHCLQDLAVEYDVRILHGAQADSQSLLGHRKSLFHLNVQEGTGIMETVFSIWLGHFPPHKDNLFFLNISNTSLHLRKEVVVLQIWSWCLHAWRCSTTEIGLACMRSVSKSSKYPDPVLLPHAVTPWLGTIPSAFSTSESAVAVLSPGSVKSVSRVSSHIKILVTCWESSSLAGRCNSLCLKAWRVSEFLGTVWVAFDPGEDWQN